MVKFLNYLYSSRPISPTAHVLLPIQVATVDFLLPKMDAFKQTHFILVGCADSKQVPLLRTSLPPLLILFHQTMYPKSELSHCCANNIVINTAATTTTTAFFVKILNKQLLLPLILLIPAVPLLLPPLLVYKHHQ